MGNIFGLSTSGIPISATWISVVPDPRPRFTKIHGGVFGPEGGLIGPFAYTLGIACLCWLYVDPQTYNNFWFMILLAES